MAITNEHEQVHEWHTAQFFSSATGPDERYTGVVVLNQPIQLDPLLFTKVWVQGLDPSVPLTKSQDQGMRGWSGQLAGRV
jgi:hypothetical protein